MPTDPSVGCLILRIAKKATPPASSPTKLTRKYPYRIEIVPQDQIGKSENGDSKEEQNGHAVNQAVGDFLFLPV